MPASPLPKPDQNFSNALGLLPCSTHLFLAFALDHNNETSKVGIGNAMIILDSHLLLGLPLRLGGLTGLLSSPIHAGRQHYINLRWYDLGLSAGGISVKLLSTAKIAEANYELTAGQTPRPRPPPHPQLDFSWYPCSLRTRCLSWISTLYFILDITLD